MIDQAAASRLVVGRRHQAITPTGGHYCGRLVAVTDLAYVFDDVRVHSLPVNGLWSHCWCGPDEPAHLDGPIEQRIEPVVCLGRAVTEIRETTR